MQPQRATATAVLTRPDERWNIAGHVDAAAFALDPWLQKPPFSLRNVALDVQANPDRIGIAGNVGIPELDSKDLTVEASGNFAKRVLTIASADVALNDSPAKVHAKGTVTFDGDVADARHRSPVGEPAVATARCRSGKQRHRRRNAARPDALRLHDDRTSRRSESSARTRFGARCAVEGTAHRRAVRCQSVRRHRDRQRRSLQFAQPRAWKLTTRADDINPVELHKEFPGRIDVRAQAEGKGFDKRASFRLALTNLRGTLRNEPVRARATVQRDGKTWQVSDARLAFGGARVTLDGKLRDTIEAQWSISAPALDRLLPERRRLDSIHGLSERRAQVAARHREAARRESAL